MSVPGYPRISPSAGAPGFAGLLGHTNPIPGFSPPPGMAGAADAAGGGLDIGKLLGMLGGMGPLAARAGQGALPYAQQGMGAMGGMAQGLAQRGMSAAPGMARGAMNTYAKGLGFMGDAAETAAPMASKLPGIGEALGGMLGGAGEGLGAAEAGLMGVAPEIAIPLLIAGFGLGHIFGHHSAQQQQGYPPYGGY